MTRTALNLTCIGISSLACVASVAQAQADATPQPEKAEAKGDQLGEIVVTAQKRAEPLQRVPIAVSVVDGLQLSELHITSNVQLSSITSGLHFSQSTIAAQPWIRGIGNSSGTPGNEPAVATYVDGVYRPSPVSAWFSYSGVERIDILKGPQGTLFGRNAAGGVVNITTRMPSHEARLDVDAGYGNFDTISGSLYATGGVTSNLAADISVSGSKQRDGFGHDQQTGRDVFLNSNLSARTKWLLEGASSQLIFAADYDRTRSGQGISFAVQPGTVTNSGVPHRGGYFDTNSPLRQNGSQEQGGVALTYKGDFDWATLTSITSWRKLRGTGTQSVDPVGLGFYQILEARQRTFTQEVNLASPGSSPVKWIAGIFYFDDRAGYRPFGQFGTSFSTNPTAGRLTFSTQTTRSYAGYAQATAPLWGESDHLTLGIRYTRDRRSIDAFRQSSPGDFALSGPPLALVFDPTIPRRVTQPKLTYKASYDHVFSPTIMSYASYSRGFKSGNYNNTGPTAAPTRPQTLDAFEIGIKTELLDRRLRVNAAGFYYFFNDLQVQSQVGTALLQTNAAKAEYRGFDVDVDAVLSSSLRARATVSFVDSEYTSYLNAPLISPNANGSAGPTIIGDATGREVAYTQPFSSSVSLQYKRDTPWGHLSLNAAATYQAGFKFDLIGFEKQASHTLVSASLNWKSKDAQWRVGLWSQNLLNERYEVTRVIVSGIGQLYSPGSPRTFGATVGRSF